MSEEMEMVRYVSQYPSLVLTMHGGVSQPMLNTRTGIQELHVVDPKFIKFVNHEFITSDAEEIEFIENSNDFKGKGTPKIIDKAAKVSASATKFVELVNEHGEETVNKLLDKAQKKLKEKAEAGQEQAKKKKAK